MAPASRARHSAASAALRWAAAVALLGVLITVPAFPARAQDDVKSRFAKQAEQADAPLLAASAVAGTIDAFHATHVNSKADAKAAAQLLVAQLTQAVRG
jgi:hypothetical protein